MPYKTLIFCKITPVVDPHPWPWGLRLPFCLAPPLPLPADNHQGVRVMQERGGASADALSGHYYLFSCKFASPTGSLVVDKLWCMVKETVVRQRQEYGAN